MGESQRSFNPLIESALRCAVSAHAEQKRKSDNSPYIVHPFSVALMLQKHGFRDEVIAAGVLHDVIEDTAVSEQFLREQVGDEVTNMVLMLSEDKSQPWRERKQAYIARVAKAGEAVKAVAVADKLHNLSCLRPH